jgi:hypothetical protein
MDRPSNWAPLLKFHPHRPIRVEAGSVRSRTIPAFPAEFILASNELRNIVSRTGKRFSPRATPLAYRWEIQLAADEAGIAATHTDRSGP